MKAIKYEIKVTLTDLDAARGWSSTIQEIWVARPDGKSFCFNEKFGLFYCEKPRSDEKQEEIEVDTEAVYRAIDFLDTRSRLVSVFRKGEAGG